jgi:hypothetical protein
MRPFVDDGGRSARQTFVIEWRKKPQVGLIQAATPPINLNPFSVCVRPALATTITNFDHRLSWGAFCAQTNSSLSQTVIFLAGCKEMGETPASPLCVYGNWRAFANLES